MRILQSFNYNTVMRTIVVLVFGVFLIIGLFLVFKKEKPTQTVDVSSKKDLNTQDNPTKSYAPRSSIFVPYWSLDGQEVDSSYDQVIYFGIGVSKAGINIGDQGYSRLKEFDAMVNGNQEKILALRMIDPSTNFDILKNKNVQESIQNEMINLAQQNDFKGIVLDLEVSSLPFGSVVNQINDFVKEFYMKSKAADLEFAILLFGDTFYKFRPYDVAYLSQYTDRVLLMAYDFHKAKGEPGPNFPLDKGNEYSYDFKTMVDDFLNIFPKDKIVVVFGLFGYDWQVNAQEQAIQQAQSLSLNQINAKFLPCSYWGCTIEKDPISLETKIQYIDASGINHVVWFEDLESVEKKKEYLKEKGIESFSYWAYSYF